MSYFYCKSCCSYLHKDWSSHLQNPTLKCSSTYYSGGYRTCCNRLPLYDAINSCAPDAVITSLLVLTQEAAEVCDRTGCLPLHTALEMKYSDHVIQALMAANKKAVRESTAAGYLPLHLAIQNKCSSKIIVALLKEYSEASKITDPNGVLPLMMAVEHKLLGNKNTEDAQLDKSLQSIQTEP